jgi:hypothetical protein
VPHLVPPTALRARIARADARTRTGDPFITSEVLYQLSYVGGLVSLGGPNGPLERALCPVLGSPLVGEQRPALVVAPAAPDLQIAR